ncbi:MAG: bifunctional glutamate N-acetyltransferase/amino-acid acetyltransferase ArgJ [Acidiferrobacterales bacterium]|nr:bifunctional glutamate N-acetyltransferase/amino-acid acetyltransferase ArgJ [Acidiferrobacterales bacterium]
MSVGLQPPGNLRPVAGIRIGAVDAGIRKSPGEDLAIFEISGESTIAGVFTNNEARAAPVDVAIDHLLFMAADQCGKIRAMVVNSGNANAGLGKTGVDDCLQVCRNVADELEIPVESVIPFSTGVIGERLPLEKFEQSVGRCVQTLNEDNWLAAAQAIMTTDTVAKGVTRVVDLGDAGQIVITGIAKGSGMINPDMATMLAFIATDAQAPLDFLETELQTAVDKSFNRITVDGDTSTNDSCMLIATGASGVRISPDVSDQAIEQFRKALGDVAVELAQAIVRDGEGATKFVTVEVVGTASPEDAVAIAKTVANSPLVKTAMHAADPNWGRIYAAIGRAPTEYLDLSDVQICIGDVEVFVNGEASPQYSEDKALEVMNNEEFTIFIDLGVSRDKSNSATVWTCDFSAEYVRINAEYRT